MERKKILVAGGAGFIGSVVNIFLQRKGYETVVLDNLSRGSKEAVVKGKLIVGDIGDRSLLQKIFREEKIDAVMHFAAWIDVGESVLEPAKYYENNVVKTLTLLEEMVRARVLSFIFSSSAAIFGIPEKIPVNEEAPKAPINPYGTTKLMVEEILKDFDRAYGLKFSSLRYFNAAGGDPEGEVKNFKLKETNLIPVALRSAKQGQALNIFGTDWETKDGTCIRDYIHIADLAEAHILALEALLKEKKSAFYNLGNGRGFSVREVVAAVERVTGRQLLVVEAERRKGDPERLVADASLAKQALGFIPKRPGLEEIVRDAWRGYGF